MRRGRALSARRLFDDGGLQHHAKLSASVGRASGIGISANYLPTPPSYICLTTP